MQNEEKGPIESLSCHRQEMRRLLGDLERSVEVVFGRTPLVKGNVYEMARKCGKLSCACSRGQLHKSMVLSWSHQGKARLGRFLQRDWRKCAGKAKSIYVVAGPR